MTPRVVIADDHSLYAEAIASVLGLSGIEVVGIALDGIQAVEISLRERPDVVFMDIAMPHMGGIDATREIVKEWASARIVMLTGSSSAKDRKLARAAGAVGYVTKDKVAALPDLIATLIARPAERSS